MQIYINDPSNNSDEITILLKIYNTNKLWGTVKDDKEPFQCVSTGTIIRKMGLSRTFLFCRDY